MGVNLPDLITDVAQQLDVSAPRLLEMLDMFHECGEYPAFERSKHEAVFEQFVETMKSAVASVNLNPDAIALLLAIDDDITVPVQLRRRMWEDGMGTRSFDVAISELMQGFLVTSNFLQPEYTLTSLGRNLMPSVYEHLGVEKLV